jgi:2-succinyl-6-hydroxy-2,4-cyclohexadiene-1-carboxylate synthase
MAEPLVLLHGFGGTHRTWDQVVEHLPPERYRPVITPDLPGHGSRAKDRPITFDACVDAVLADAPDEPFVLAGYSLGGRVAQHVAVAAPERVSRLVLISSAPGVPDGEERAAADDALADVIESLTPEDFAARWQELPIFAGTPEDALPRWREDLTRTPPHDLAAALRGLTVGRMRVFSEPFAMPVTRIVGERDLRYRALAGPDAVVIPGAGHGLPREAPEALAALI